MQGRITISVFLCLDHDLWLQLLEPLLFLLKKLTSTEPTPFVISMAKNSHGNIKAFLSITFIIFVHLGWKNFTVSNLNNMIQPFFLSIKNAKVCFQIDKSQKRKSHFLVFFLLLKEYNKNMLPFIFRKFCSCKVNSSYL